MYLAAEEVWDEANHEYEFTSLRVQQDRAKCDEARRFLYSSAGPAVLAASRKAKTALASASNSLAKMRKDVEHVRALAASAEQELKDAIDCKELVAAGGYVGPRVTEKQARDRVELFKKDLERRERAIVAAQNALNDAQARATAARAKLLQP